MSLRSACVGIVHPGAMGSALGRALRVANACARVIFASHGRSPDTIARAQADGIEDVGTLEQVVQQSNVILSVCPPANALEVAQQCRSFTGLYVDANAISPQTAQAVAAVFSNQNNVVDASIHGYPPQVAGKTRLLLSGARAHEISELFNGTIVGTRIIGESIGQASALKMCISANYKAHAALLFNIRALAQHHGIDQQLLDEWAHANPKVAELCEHHAGIMPRKAWRFLGEMDEMAATFTAAGLPDQFFKASQDVFSRLVDFKATTQTTTINDVCDAILAPNNKGEEKDPTTSTTEAPSTAQLENTSTDAEAVEAVIKLAEGDHTLDNATQATAPHPLPHSPKLPKRKLRVMCLHGWRTNADILAKQLRSFPQDLLEMHYINGTMPASGFDCLIAA